MSEAEYLLQQILLIQEGYQKQIQPYVERLARLRALEEPKPMYLSADQSIGLQKFNQENQHENF